MTPELNKKEPDKRDDLHIPHHAQQDTLRPTPTLKVVLLGDLGVGKTCLRSQFVHHVFSNAYKATIGGDYLTTSVEIETEDGNENGNYRSRDERTATSSKLTGPDTDTQTRFQTVSLQVWDTAGQERYNLISQAFYRGADVAVLVYDITNYASILSIRDWFSRFLQHCQVDTPGILIVGNKSDRNTERAVDRHEVEHVLCRHGNVPWGDHVTDWANDVLEVSCRSLGSVDAVFKRAAQIGLDKTLSDHCKDQYYGKVSIVNLGDAQAVSSRCAC